MTTSRGGRIKNQFNREENKKDFDENVSSHESLIEGQRENEGKTTYDRNLTKKAITDFTDWNDKDLNDSSDFYPEEVSMSSKSSKYSDEKQKNHRH